MYSMSTTHSIKSNDTSSYPLASLLSKAILEPHRLQRWKKYISDLKQRQNAMLNLKQVFKKLGHDQNI